MKLAQKNMKVIALSIIFMLLSACASASQPLTTEEKEKGSSYAHLDPYQRYNRTMFKINTKFDKYLGKPVATFYNKVVPRPINKGITNALTNLSGVPTVINDLLQLRFYQATSDAWRFGINSTVGIFGLFDVATPMGLQPNRQNFGLTLAKWGWKESDYLVLPVLGPSTIRNTGAIPIDWLTSSYYHFLFLNDREVFTFGLIGLKLVDERAQLLQYQNVFQQISLDPYIFVRNAYLQRQAYLIKLNDEPVKYTYPWGKENQLWILN